MAAQNKVAVLAEKLFVATWHPDSGYVTSRLADDCKAAAEEYCAVERPKSETDKKE